MERFESTVQIELSRLIERVLAMKTTRSENEQSQGGAVREVDMSGLMSYSLLCVLGVLVSQGSRLKSKVSKLHIARVSSGYSSQL